MDAAFNGNYLDQGVLDMVKEFLAMLHFSVFIE